MYTEAQTASSMSFNLSKCGMEGRKDYSKVMAMSRSSEQGKIKYDAKVEQY